MSKDYQVWYWPDVWPSDVEPHWLLALETEHLNEAYIEYHRRGAQEGTKVWLTRTVNVEVIES